VDHPVRSARLQRVIEADLGLDCACVVCDLDPNRGDVDGCFLAFEDLPDDLLGLLDGRLQAGKVLALLVLESAIRLDDMEK
jgi:hypothetical protein